MWGYPCPAPLLQLTTTLKRHPSSRAPLGAGWDLCCYWSVSSKGQFSFLSAHPTQKTSCKPTSISEPAAWGVQIVTFWSAVHPSWVSPLGVCWTLSVVVGLEAQSSAGGWVLRSLTIVLMIIVLREPHYTYHRQCRINALLGEWKDGSPTQVLM